MGGGKNKVYNANESANNLGRMFIPRYGDAGQSSYSNLSGDISTRGRHGICIVTWEKEILLIPRP